MMMKKREVRENKSLFFVVLSLLVFGVAGFMGWGERGERKGEKEIFKSSVCDDGFCDYS